ncbi:hypothetical protein CYCD_08510 [Tenuifilaceae bacterium CYCD]|nr:hypothetical protein CYCD_08510 [Tenuifilaceae bacterium CYCD]
MVTRKEILYRYSEYSVNHRIEKDLVVGDMLKSLNGYKVFVDNISGTRVKYYYVLNTWETDFFGINSVFLRFIDFDLEDINILQESIKRFLRKLYEDYGKQNITIEIPSEDNKVIQVLNCAKFRLIETRIHFYNSNLECYNGVRANVRVAKQADIENLKRVASFMRNNYDRFHSDFSFKKADADRYLSTYIENSINGFTDLVMVPNEPNLPSDSFLTANILRDKWAVLNHNISKMVLSAVSSETNKGWYVKLISEMTYLLKEIGAETIFMNTQSTNIAVLHTWEKLGYHIGRTTHILSKHVE